MTVIKDTLKLARKWQDAGIEQHQAEKMVEALSDDLDVQVVTRADLQIAMAELKSSLIQWIATLLIAQVGVLFALLKFFPS